MLAIIKLRRIKFYAPKDIETLLNNIKIAERRIYHVDREILACAYEDKAQALVTLDREMINNRNLERMLKIKILHPRDLL